MMELYLHSPIRVRGLVLNFALLTAAVFPTLKGNLSQILCSFTYPFLNVTQQHTRSQNRL
jgi:hypothetical protein